MPDRTVQIAHVRRALTLGARDFLAKPFDVTEVLLRIKNLLETRFMHTAMARHSELLEEKVAERTVHLWQAVQDLSRAQEETRDATHEMIKRLASAAELRDAETGRHIERMSRYAGLLAARLDLGSERCETIVLAASMHDIGKIGVPDAILRKEGALTPDEMRRMSEHAEIGHRILAGSDASVVDMAALIALTHHERWDGGGYPRGLAGDAIPLEGRIAAVADVFDALTSDRVYRPAFAIDVALEMMQEGSGKHFDPDVLELFLASIDDVLDVHEQYSDGHLARHAL